MTDPTDAEILAAIEYLDAVALPEDWPMKTVIRRAPFKTAFAQECLRELEEGEREPLYPKP